MGTRNAAKNIIVTPSNTSDDKYTQSLTKSKVIIFHTMDLLVCALKINVIQNMLFIQLSNSIWHLISRCLDLHSTATAISLRENCKKGEKTLNNFQSCATTTG